MSNINGKVYAMNAVTPMKTWKTWVLRIIFFVLGHIKTLQKDLIDLSFIEFARWVIVPRNGFPFMRNGQTQGGPEVRLPALLQQLQRDLEPIH